MPPESYSWVSCATCGRPVSLELARGLADAEREHRAAEVYAAYVEDVAMQWRRVADYWGHRHADARQAVAAAARNPIEEPLWQPSVAGHPPQRLPAQPAVPAVTPPVDRVPSASAEHPSKSRRAVPTAVVLQGTGAVMILAAVVLVSAFAWTFLPPAGQAMLLCGVVMVLAVVTVATRGRVPTTSAILAGLSAAVYVVVAVAIPVVLSGVDLRWYPVGVAALGAALSLWAGWQWRVTLWRHVGWAVLPVVALLFVGAVCDVLAQVSRWPVAVLLACSLSAGYLLLAERQVDRDAETSVTALWSAVALSATTLVTGAVMSLAGLPVYALPDRLWVGAAIVGCALVAVMLAHVMQATGRGGSAWLSPAGLAVMPLGVVVATIPVPVASVTAALMPAAVLAGLLIAGEWARTRVPAARHKGWLAGAIGWSFGWVFVTQSVGPLLDREAANPWLWLTYLSVSLMTAVFLVAHGLLVRRGLLVLLGTGIAVVAWSWAWWAGDLGGWAETWVLPIGAWILVAGSSAQRRMPDLTLPALWRPATVMAASVVPVAGVVSRFAGDGRLDDPRGGIVVALDVLMAVLAVRLPGGKTLTVAWVSAQLAALGVVALVRAEFAVVPEALLLPVALAVGATVLSARAERIISLPWVAAPLATGAVILFPATVIATLDPMLAMPGAALRGVAVLVVWVVAAGALWRHRRSAAACATVAGVLLAEWYGVWLAEQPVAATVPEAWTVPLAVIATAVLWWWLRVPTPPAPRRKWWLAAPTALVWTVSAAAAVVDPRFDDPYATARAWAVMVSLGIITVIGRHRPVVVAAAATAAGFLAMEWYAVWLADRPLGDVIEMWTIPAAALGAALIWLWQRTGPAPARNWWPALPAVIAVGLSTAASLAAPYGSGDPVADFRALAVLGLWWAAAAATLRWPRVFVVTFGAAVALTWLQLVAAIAAAGTQVPVEAYSWTAALGAALWLPLLKRVTVRPLPTLLTAGPVTLLALAPTALVAWSGGTASWRVWFVLVAGGAVLVAGVHWRWAGLVWPALIALACVVVPVLTTLASDAPAWVPLALVGTVLLILGARFESLRRQGHSAAHWAATLH